MYPQVSQLAAPKTDLWWDVVDASRRRSQDYPLRMTWQMMLEGLRQLPSLGACEDEVEEARTCRVVVRY